MSSPIRLPRALLLRTNRFLLKLYETADLGQLRGTIPHGLGQLIPADRVSLNFVGPRLGGRTTVIPANIPRYWSRLGEVYCRHAHEHVLNRASKRLHRVAGFNDWRSDLDWNRSILCNEYYRPIGCHQHIGVNVFRTGGDFVNIGFNRGSCDFCREERGVLQLLSPHLGNALRRAWQYEAEDWTGCFLQPGSQPVQAVIELSRPTGRVTRLSPAAGAMIRRHTDCDSGEGRLLPEIIRRWLAAQREQLRSSDSLACPFPLTLRCADRRLTVTLGQLNDETELLMLRETRDHRAAATHARLTPREREVLEWLAAGKRNGEIAAIVGAGIRTVEKHVEHIFAKLGTRTRTATMLRALETPRNHHA